MERLNGYVGHGGVEVVYAVRFETSGQDERLSPTPNPTSDQALLFDVRQCTGLLERPWSNNTINSGHTLSRPHEQNTPKRLCPDFTETETDLGEGRTNSTDFSPLEIRPSKIRVFLSTKCFMKLLGMFWKGHTF